MNKLLYPVSKHLKEELKEPKFRKLYDSSAIKFKIGAQLIKYRINHNLTQGQLGHKVGVTQQQISKIENGDFSNFSTLEQVFRAINYSLDVKAVPEGRQAMEKYQAVEEIALIPEKIMYFTGVKPKSASEKSFAKLSRFSIFKDDQESNLRISENRIHPLPRRRKLSDPVVA